MLFLVKIEEKIRENLSRVVKEQNVMKTDMRERERVESQGLNLNFILVSSARADCFFLLSTSQSNTKYRRLFRPPVPQLVARRVEKAHAWELLYIVAESIREIDEDSKPTDYYYHLSCIHHYLYF